MCIRDSIDPDEDIRPNIKQTFFELTTNAGNFPVMLQGIDAVSYTHLRAHETVLDLVCRLLLEKKKQTITYNDGTMHTNSHRNTYYVTVP